jgi:hypothetical protein
VGVTMTIKRTTNWSEEGTLHVEVTEDPIEQHTDRSYLLKYVLCANDIYDAIIANCYHNM